MYQQQIIDRLSRFKFFDTTEKDRQIYTDFYDMCVFPQGDLLVLLKSRGFKDRTISTFGWRTIPNRAVTEIQRKYSLDELRSAGLFSDKGFVFHYHRILVPYFLGNEIVSLRARTTITNAQAKYLNLIGKGSSIYNYDSVLQLVGDSSLPRRLLIAEGETDTMTLSQAGFYAIGVPGAGQSEHLLKLLALLSDCFNYDLQVVLCYDNDVAGRQAFKNVAIECLNLGLNPCSYQIPVGYKDISECFTAEGDLPIGGIHSLIGDVHGQYKLISDFLELDKQHNNVFSAANTAIELEKIAKMSPEELESEKERLLSLTLAKFALLKVSDENELIEQLCFEWTLANEFYRVAQIEKALHGTDILKTNKRPQNYFNDSQLEQAKRVPVSEIAGVHLRKVGKSLVGLCPLHSEKHPSFNINPNFNVWYCFGCNQGGDSIELVKRINGYTFKEAVTYLLGL